MATLRVLRWRYLTCRNIAYCCLLLVGSWLTIIWCSSINSPKCSDSPLPHSSRLSQSSFLVIFILTAPESVERRAVIRQTWLRFDRNIFYKFVVGSANLDARAILSLKNEGDDILLLPDVGDDYKALSKKVLHTLVWLAKNVEFEYVLKLDDDSFVRLDALHELLRHMHEHGEINSHLYWGFFDGRAHVKHAGKWAEQDWVLCDRYLPHAVGGGYVLGKTLVHFIAQNAHLLKLYNNEDVAVGTWLAGLNVQYRHDTRFDTEYLSRGCSESYLITHKQDDEAMKELYNRLKETEKLCKLETKKRLSYIYNWKIFDRGWMFLVEFGDNFSLNMSDVELGDTP